MTLSQVECPDRGACPEWKLVWDPQSCKGKYLAAQIHFHQYADDVSFLLIFLEIMAVHRSQCFV